MHHALLIFLRTSLRTTRRYNRGFGRSSSLVGRPGMRCGRPQVETAQPDCSLATPCFENAAGRRTGIMASAGLTGGRRPCGCSSAPHEQMVWMRKVRWNSAFGNIASDVAVIPGNTEPRRILRWLISLYCRAKISSLAVCRTICAVRSRRRLVAKQLPSLNLRLVRLCCLSPLTCRRQLKHSG